MRAPTGAAARWSRACFSAAVRECVRKWGLAARGMACLVYEAPHLPFLHVPVLYARYMLRPGGRQSQRVACVGPPASQRDALVGL